MRASPCNGGRRDTSSHRGLCSLSNAAHPMQRTLPMGTCSERGHTCRAAHRLTGLTSSPVGSFDAPWESSGSMGSMDGHAAGQGVMEALLQESKCGTMVPRIYQAHMTVRMHASAHWHIMSCMVHGA